MNYLLLLFTCGASAMSTILKKQFQTKSRHIYSFVALCTGAALLFFAATTRNWQLNKEIIIHGTAFAAAYYTANVFLQKALNRGALALTSMVNSFSLLLPTFFGIIFLNEPITWTFAIGVVCVLLAILFTSNFQNTTNAGISFLWIVFVFLAFAGNGMCSVTQRVGQTETGNVNLMMVVALCEVTVANFILAWAKEGRTGIVTTFRRGWYLAIGSGLFNGLTNLFVILLNTRMSASIMFPVIGGLSLFISFVASLFYYKERFSKVQLVGFGIALISVIVLNL